MRKGSWLPALLGVLLISGTAVADELTLRVRQLVFNPDDRTCEAAFYLESLTGEVPPGLSVDYASLQDGDLVLQRCTFTQMTLRDGEWTCKQGFLDTCQAVGTIAVHRTACLDNLRNEIACGPIVIAADDDLLVDKRKK